MTAVVTISVSVFDLLTTLGIVWLNIFVFARLRDPKVHLRRRETVPIAVVMSYLSWVMWYVGGLFVAPIALAALAVTEWISSIVPQKEDRKN